MKDSTKETIRVVGTVLLIICGMILVPPLCDALFGPAMRRAYIEDQVDKQMQELRETLNK